MSEQIEHVGKDGRSHFRVTGGNCACGWTIINDFEWRLHLKRECEAARGGGEWAALREALRHLQELLSAATVRFTRDHGEPNPSLAIPYEVVFACEQWNRVLNQMGRVEALAAAPSEPPSEVGPHEEFQHRVHPWMLACFGAAISSDKVERNHRFLEEALELVHSCGTTQSEAHQLVDYVYGRPMGQASQEVGGVMVTLAALCLAQGLDMHASGETELSRIWTKVEEIRAKQAAKPKHSPLAAPAPKPAPPAELTVGQIKVIIYDALKNQFPDVCTAIMVAEGCAPSIYGALRRAAERGREHKPQGGES